MIYHVQASKRVYIVVTVGHLVHIEHPSSLLTAPNFQVQVQQV